MGWPSCVAGLNCHCCERVEHELGVRKSRRKCDAQALEAARFIDKTVDHEGIGVDRAGREIGAHNVIRPGCIEAGDGAAGGGIGVARKRVLQEPAFGQPHMQISGIGNPAAPSVRDLGILIFKRIPHDHGAETAVLGQRDLRERGLA